MKEWVKNCIGTRVRRITEIKALIACACKLNAHLTVYTGCVVFAEGSDSQFSECVIIIQVKINAPRLLHTINGNRPY